MLMGAVEMVELAWVMLAFSILKNDVTFPPDELSSRSMLAAASDVNVPPLFAAESPMSALNLPSLLEAI
jgi:hypothetical protein